MGRVPLLKSEQVAKALYRLGFVNTRRKGSHFRFVHPDGRKTTVPMHKGKQIGRGLLRAIMNDINISIDEFEQYL